VFFLFTRGLHLSIEFTGGTVLEVEYAQPADIDKTRTVEPRWASARCRCRTSAPRATC
jgi:preprotein translocase subunit SecF